MNTKATIKDSAAGRWPEILQALGGIPLDILDEKHHGCPKCGGKDRFRLIDKEAGAVLCSQCFSEKNGDGIATLQWANNWSFTVTLDRLAEYLGIENPNKQGRCNQKKKQQEQLEQRNWNPTLVAMWARHKGVTLEAVRENGGQLARWRGRETVVAFPILTQKLKATGWVFYNSNGKELVKSDGTAAKILVTAGARAGWIGQHAIENLDSAVAVWKVEGPSDMLALWSRMPPAAREKHVVVTNAFGAGEKPRPELLEIFRGKKVMVVHDEDDAGRRGAERWAGAIAQVAAETKIVHLPEEGHDLRDWLEAGHGYRELVTLAKAADAIQPEPETKEEDEADEAENDPSRLAYLFVRQFAGRIACYLEQIYYWEAGRWLRISGSEFRSDLTIFLRKEFHRLNLEAREEAKKKDVPPPKAHKITLGLLQSVTSNIKAYCCVSDKIYWGTLLERGGGLERATEGEKKEWIAVENGILQVSELLEGKRDVMRPHTPEWWSPHRLPFAFDPAAGPETCPHWQNFLRTNLGGEGESAAAIQEEKAMVLQEWAGYCLIPDTDQQRFLMIEGEGANGKSVYCAVLEALLGEDNVAHVPLELFGQRFALTTTLGKLANIATEIGELDKVAEGYLKSFTSGEAMNFDRKNKKPIDCKPTARLVLATNNRPRFSDRSQGVWRRVLHISFDVTIPEDKRIRGMDKPEWWRRSGEMPGIFNWALDGLVRLMFQGRFTETESGKQALEDYQLETNPAREFLIETYEANDQGRIFVNQMYEEYSKFCKDSGYFRLGKRQFGKEVRRAFRRVSKTRPAGDDGRPYCYDGISKKKGSSSYPWDA